MHIVDIALQAAFFCSVLAVAYSYLLYPILIGVLASIVGKARRPPHARDGELPRIALLIVAHNEAPVIEARIHNALSLDYPRERLEIVVASDGSDDGTVEICRGFGNRIRLLAFMTRCGKAATLNHAMAQIDADVVALSDANTHMDYRALRRLARWFAAQDVGVVCGRLVLSDPKSGRNVDSLYWKYETHLKRCEARLGALLGANGAIYAIRRRLFVPLPEGTLVDDFVVPLAARMHSGCRIEYDAQSVAREETAADLRGEFGRRVRIGSGGFQALRTLWPMLHPRWGWTALALWSHKVLRWACPLFLIGALATSALLSGQPAYRAALMAQLAFYAVCVAGGLLPPAKGPLRGLRIFPMFAGMNAALLVGFLRWAAGGTNGTWRRTARGE